MQDETEAPQEELEEASPREFTDDIDPEVLALLQGDTEAPGADESTQEDAESQEEEESTEEEEGKPSDSFSRRFNQLSERERAVQERESRVKATEEGMQRLQAAAREFQDNPVAFIKEEIATLLGTQDEEAVSEMLGRIHEEMTLQILGVEAPPEYREQSEVKRLQRELAEYKRQQEEEKLLAQQTAAISQAKADIQSELLGAKENFPYLTNQREQPAHEVVWDIILTDYNNQQSAGVENPTAMSIAEAAEKADNFFREYASQWASLVQPPANNTPSKQPQTKAATNGSRSSKTLTNKGASTAPTRETDGGLLSEEESIARSIAMLKN